MTRCSGAMSSAHNDQDPQPVRLSVTLVRVLCAPCRDAAARLGMLVPERRAEPRPAAGPANPTVVSSGLAPCDRGGFCEPSGKPLAVGA